MRPRGLRLNGLRSSINRPFAPTLVDMAAATGVDWRGRPLTAFSSSSYSASYMFWAVVSETNTGPLGIADWATAGVQANYFGGVIYVAPIFAKSIRLRGRGHNTEYPLRWRIEASNDTTNGFDGAWAVLLDKTANNESLQYSLGIKEFDLGGAVAYKAYRIFVTASIGPNPGLNSFQIIGAST